MIPEPPRESADLTEQEPRIDTPLLERLAPHGRLPDEARAEVAGRLGREGPRRAPGRQRQGQGWVTVSLQRASGKE